VPPVDIAETDRDVTVTMQVPGVERDQLQVTLRDDLLSVRGEMKHEAEERKRRVFRQEIRYGAFQRDVRLPAEIDAEKAKADLKNGLLTIVAPKAAQSRTHRIDVAVR
jgi:HSP20 family protein